MVIKIKIYTILFLIVFYKINKQILIKSILVSFFPIIYSVYWFITAYLIFYLITPLLNNVLKNIRKNYIRRIIIFSIIIYSIFSHLMGGEIFYSSVIWFCILYIIVYYIKKYVDVNLISNISLKWICVLTYFFIFLSILSFDFLGISQNIASFRKYSIYFISENSLLVLCFSISFFLIFFKGKSYKNKIINYLAKGTLGIYLVHENIFMRPYLYNNILNTHKYLNKTFIYFLLYSIISIIFIFLLGLCIDNILNILMEWFSIVKIEVNLRKKIIIILKFIIKNFRKIEKRRGSL